MAQNKATPKELFEAYEILQEKQVAIRKLQHDSARLEITIKTMLIQVGATEALTVNWRKVRRLFSDHK